MTGLYGSLIAGVSGIRAYSQGLATISDNLANSGTVGYKRVETRFSSLVTASSPAVHSPGGVRSSTKQLVDQAGLLLGTVFETDVAIDGSGFFAVTDVQVRQPGDEFLYTRAGSFRADKDGYLRNDAGFFLQAWRLDPVTGALPTGASSILSLQTVNVSNITGNPTPTSTLSLGATLNSQAAAGDTVTSNLTIYDSLGTDHPLRINWTKGATDNTWLATIVGGTPTSVEFEDNVAGTRLDNNTAVNLATIGSGTATGAGNNYLRVIFNTDGSLASVQNMATGDVLATLASPTFDLRFDPPGGAAANQVITFDFGTPGDTDGITQFDVERPDPVRFFTQDGVAFGTLTGVSIDDEGIIEALFDNGEQKPIYKIPVVEFANPNALQAESGNAYTQTANSGDFVLNEAGFGGAGRINSFSLEASTVDIAEEFTNMIVVQRSYSANTRSISTADEMLQELLNIRR